MIRHHVFGLSVVAAFASVAIGVTACVPDPGPGSTTHTVKAVRVTSGRYHTCTILSDTTARCWGFNDLGQLGNGTFVSSATPVKVSGLSNLTQITAGAQGTCALRYDGTVWCWGENDHWETGTYDGVDPNDLEPVPAPRQVLISGVTQIASGDEHSCALKNGTVWCWGNNSYGELGVVPGTIFPDGENTARTTIPQLVPGISTAVQVSAGTSYSCAALANGSVVCWGSNAFGKITLGTETTSEPPTVVPGVADVVEVTVGEDHACGRTSAGATICWGYQAGGELGNGLGVTLGPVTVGMRPIIAIDTASSYGQTTCATLADRTAKCWGNNASGIISPGFGDDGFPHARSGLTGITDMGVGLRHACAVVVTGTVKCWGANGSGELGHGTIGPDEFTPIDVVGIPFVSTTPIDCSARGVGVDLRGCDLTGVNLSGGNLSDADLSGANLTGADLTDAVLTNTIFTGADLSNTDLTHALGFGTGDVSGVVYLPLTHCPDGRSILEITLSGGTGCV